MNPGVIIAPVEEPVTVEEARAHVEDPRYGDTDLDPNDDAMIEGLLLAAREYCENYLGLSLSQRTLEIGLDQFPCAWPHHSRGIDLPMGPVREVLTVAWGEGSEDEMANEAFVLDTFSTPHRLLPLSGWPTTVTRSPNVIRIRYRAGYGVDSDDSDGGLPLPRSIRAAILLYFGHLYANREATTDAGLGELPLGVRALLDPYRVRLGMA